MFMRNLLLLLLMVVFLAGCGATRIPLSPENAKQIKNIHIKSDIKKPERMSYQGRWANAGVGFGLVGLAVGKAAGMKGENEMRNLAVGHVNITDIVYQQWARQLNQANFNLKQPEDATLVVDIDHYGIMVPNVFTNKYYPIVHINAKLIRKNKVVWQDSGQTNGLYPSEDVPRYDFEEIKKDPKKLQAMLNKASEKVIVSMIQDMKKQ